MAARKSTKPKIKKCACGCGATVTRTFKQGHDQRLKGVLGRAFRAGESVTINGKTTTAAAAIKAHGWAAPTPLAKDGERTSTAKGSRARGKGA